MADIYDVIFVGSGPSAVFGILSKPELAKLKCLVIEKGDSIENRDHNEVLYGFGGAGTYSDGKLVANPYVGGDIKDLLPDMWDEHFYDLSDQILETCKKFYTGDKPIDFSWMDEDNYEVPSEKLKLLKSKVCHIGTNTSRGIFLNMQKHIQENICPINFNEEVLEIKQVGIRGHFVDTPGYEIITNKQTYYTERIVLALGKRGNLVQKLIKQFDLKYKSNKVQMGIRVEAPNIYLKELIKKFYDFKVVMPTNLGRIRTFCACGSEEKAAFVAVEKGKDFWSVNGHSYNDRPNNGLINFGVMASLNLDLDKDEQIKLMQKVNGDTEQKILAQNIEDFLQGVTTAQLNYTTSMNRQDYRLGNLWDYYPEEVCEDLCTYLREFKNNFKLEGHFFAPEIKLVNPLIEMISPFEICPGLYTVGDCSGYSRSIIQGGIIGIIVCKQLIGEQN